MPFWTLDNHPEPEILLKQVGPNAFQLTKGFRYQVPDNGGRIYTVPPHDLKKPAEAPNNSTDLASVPPWLWWFVASHGRQTRAALLHDHLVNDPKAVPRKEADRVFRIALRESDVPWLRRWLMWTAVSLATMKETALMLPALFGVHLLAFPVSFACWLHGSLPWWTPLLIGLLGFFWGVRRWSLAAVGIVLVSLPTLFVWLSLGVVWLIDLLVAGLASMRSGETFKMPRMVPTGRRLF